MVRVGIIGLGFMGQTHLRNYQKLGDLAEIVAIADVDPKRAAGDFSTTFSNLGDQGLQPLDMSRVKGTTDYRELLAMENVDLIDICIPTAHHRDLAAECIATGKHVLCEKPLARTSEEAHRTAQLATAGKGYFMPAMCIRFWPQWRWLKEAIDDKRYGHVRSAHFTRLATPPPGWYRDGRLSGGAALDLHIHDADFVRYCFDDPQAVSSRGYVGPSGAVDHLLTHYHFENIPLVSAEGGWAMADGFGFRMRYTVNFDHATADYDLAREQPLIVHQNSQSTPIDCPATDGWFEEIRYLLTCIQVGQHPTIVTAADAAKSIRLVELEVQSTLEGGRLVPVKL